MALAIGVKICVLRVMIVNVLVMVLSPSVPVPFSHIVPLSADRLYLSSDILSGAFAMAFMEKSTQLLRLCGNALRFKTALTFVDHASRHTDVPPGSAAVRPADLRVATRHRY